MVNISNIISKEFELVIEKLKLEDRNIFYKIDNDSLHTDKSLCVNELNSVAVEFDLSIYSSKETHTLIHNWASI